MTAFLMAIALAAGGSAIPGGQDRTLPAALGDLGQAKLVEVRDQTGEALLTGTFTTAKNTPKKLERKAELTSPSGQKAKGDVEVEIELKNGVATKDEIELELENLPAMATCQVFIDGQTVTSFVTNKAGKAKLELGRKLTSPGR